MKDLEGIITAALLDLCKSVQDLEDSRKADRVAVLIASQGVNIANPRGNPDGMRVAVADAILYDNEITRQLAEEAGGEE